MQNSYARRLRWALVLTGVAVVLLVGYTGHQAVKAKDNLQQVAADFETLSGQLTSGDEAGARRTLADAQDHARVAKLNTQGPGWWVTGQLPGVAPNVHAVRTVADVTDRLSRDVLPGVVEATSTLEPARLRPHDGRVDLTPISEVAPAVVRSDRRLQVQAARVAALATDELAPQIAKPVRLLQAKLARAGMLSDRAARAVRLLPPMLGADGRRTYLVIFQNNAELRSTGGIPGAFATITADHGRITMGRQGDASTIGKFDTPPIPLTRAEQAVFGTKIGEYPQDVTFTPDFPRTAELIRAMWQDRYGVKIDGVISTDPVALSYLLRGTGRLALPDGQRLTADNAVRMLLNQVYFRIPDPRLQNLYFAAVARKVFDGVSAGQGNPHEVLSGLAQAGHEQRILLWSSRPDEQRLIDPTLLSGALSTEPGKSPRVGVYLNDATGAKMDYYVRYAVSVDSTRCQARRQYLTATVRMTSSVPKDTRGLPDYVFRSSYGVPRGVVRTTVSAFAPAGGYFLKSLIDGTDEPFTKQSFDTRPVTSQTIDLAPGQTRVLTFEMVSGPRQTQPATLRVTPGVPGSGAGAVSGSACS